MAVLELPPPALRFTVYGIPSPKGSKSAFPIRRKTGAMGAVIVEGKTPNQADWLRRVEAVVQQRAQEGAPILNEPLEAHVTFYLPKPKSAPKTRRTWPDRKPDLDKLTRALLDALTGVLVKDDARFIHEDLWKRFADDDPLDQRPRAEVEVWRVADLVQNLFTSEEGGTGLPGPEGGNHLATSSDADRSGQPTLGLGSTP